MTGRYIKPPPPQYQFQPGQSGNPGGKKKGQLTKDKVSGIIGQISGFSLEETKDISDNAHKSVLERTVARIFLEAYEKSDPYKLEFLFQRSIGKVTEQIDVKQIEPFILNKRDGTQVIAGVKQLEAPDDDES